MARVATLVLVLAAAACGREEPTREYTVVGQIVAVSSERPEVTIKHEDIKDFMPAMTMPFPVKDRSLLEGRQPGDLVTATLVIGETTVHLSSLEKTGHQPLDPSTAAGVAGAREGEPVTDARFVDENGKPRTLADLRGHRVALTFIYTRCPVPDFCPLMNRHFATVQESLRRRTDLRDVRLLSVTLDPEYDRPPVLKAQAEAYGADPAIWSFLTGETKDLQTFASQFGIYSEADPQSGEIIHSLRTVVIDGEGRLVRNTSGNDWTPAELLADLTRTPAPAR